MNTQTTRRYFAASNSSRGFKNYYGECFSDARVDRLYIIKGGPGTGKSHFMREVARHARLKGYEVTEYDCSSDPSSLDGILLSAADRPAIGLLDGTAPHIWEPKSPGVREEIINLGAFWDSARLAGEKDAVFTLAARKSAAYARAYACLRAAGEMDAVAEALLAPTVKEERLAALADRILRRIPDGRSYNCTPALRSAMGITGRVTHHTFEDESEMLFVLDASYGLGFHVTSHLFRLSAEQRKTHRVLVSYDPVYPDKIDGLLYSESGVCVLVGNAEPREGCPTRTVSLRRYTETDAFCRVRGEVRHAISMRRTLEEDALRALTDAGKHHFELEKIYAATMDFGAKETFTARFCESAL